jgi:hypothetical protein
MMVSAVASVSDPKAASLVKALGPILHVIWSYSRPLYQATQVAVPMRVTSQLGSPHHP